METAIWQEYENGIDYQRRMGFRERFPEYIRFKEGDQWPPATARTRNLPRPVFNIVEMFIRTKRAAVLNPHIAMTYLPVTEEAAQGACAEVVCMREAHIALVIATASFPDVERSITQKNFLCKREICHSGENQTNA